MLPARWRPNSHSGVPNSTTAPEIVTLLSTNLQRPAGHHLTNVDPQLRRRPRADIPLSCGRDAWDGLRERLALTALRFSHDGGIARGKVMMPGVLIHLRMAHAGSRAHLIGALILLFGLFSVLDIDSPTSLGMSTDTGIATETPQEEIRHPGLDHGPQLPLPEAHRNWHGILAVSARQAHPAPTSPVMPPCDRISPGTLPRSTLPDAPPAG